MNLAVFHFVFDLGCQILLLKKWQININLNISCLSLINQLIRILLLKYLLVNFQMIDFGFMIGTQRFSRKVELDQCGNVLVKVRSTLYTWCIAFSLSGLRRICLPTK